MRRTIIIPLVFIVGLVLAYMVQQGPRRPDIVPLETGKEAPDIMVKDLEGNDVRLSDYKGKLVFLNFWATWCPPCREEMPSMERLFQALKDRPFAMLAVSVDPSLRTVARFKAEFGYSFPILWDHEQEASRLYGTTGVPETFIIAPDGTLLFKIIGPDDWSKPENVSAIEKLLPRSRAEKG
jgi:peroxiredoxin